jgi:ribose-phosphate pyrophosphokinase
MSSVYGELRVFTGNANPVLAERICRYIGIPLGRAEVFEFSNENIFVRILESVRENDVFVVQPLCRPINRSIMELLIMIDALKRASAGRITAVMPFFGYGRTDKKDQPRVPITARLLADMISVAGAHRVLALDLHAGQIQGFFNIPVDELTASFLIGEYFREKRLKNLCVLAPDLGSAKRARNVAELVDASLAIIEKRRVGNEDQSEVLNVIGSVAGCPVLIVDDEIDTASSICHAAAAARAHGASEIYAACTHPVLSGPAFERLRNSPIKELVCTDTIPLPADGYPEMITQLSVANILGETIQRIHTGTSVTWTFQ